MPDALLLVASPGSVPEWPLVPVSGLPAVERNLMALRSAGVTRVRLACGSVEQPVLERHFARRRADRRLPAVAVAPMADASEAEPAGTCRRREDGVLVVDGRAVYHPKRFERALAGPPGAPAPGEPGLYQEDITTPAGRRRARRAIRQSLRKPTDGWFARTIDRNVSLAISAVLAPLPVHPNAVTLGTLLVGVASGLLAARGTYGGFVAAGALFLLASVLDGVDGEMARMKFQGSDFGQWLDTVCDDLTNAIYLAGLTVGTYESLASSFLLWSGVAAVALDVVTVSLLYWQLATTVGGRTLLAFEVTILGPALAEPGVVGLVARLQPFIKRDVYAPLFLLFALGGVAWLALPGAAMALAVTLVFVVRDLVQAPPARAGA